MLVHRHAADRRARVGAGAAGASLAPRDVAQRHQPPVGGAVRRVRVTPANDWRNRRLPPRSGSCANRTSALTPRIKYFFVHLPATASLAQLVRLAHQRWAIEQQYQELKTELGLDHFEGRSYPGWHHHVVLTAVAYAFLQRERMRRGADPALTLPAVRAIVHRDFHGAAVCAETVLFQTHPRTTENSASDLTKSY